jgi:hypothetical protein
VPRALLLGALLLAGCTLDEGPPQPLTPLAIRSRLFGHMLEATPAGGARYLIRFARPNQAEIIGQSREFVRWYIDAARGLCLQRYQAEPACAPLYQLNVAHFRWGDTVLSDLTVRTPGFDRDRDRDGPGLFPER